MPDTGPGPAPDPLDDPAALWPDPPEDGPGAPAAPRWVWAAMDPAERRARFRELAAWVAWLTAAHELHNTIPACWYRHPKIREHLTALYAGWVRSYCQEENTGRDLAEAEWISTLHAMEPYLKMPACAPKHVPPPAPPPEREAREREERAQALEEYLLTSDFGTEAGHHPAPDEALRLVPAEPPL